MSSYTEFDSELYVKYATKASRVLKDDYWVITKSFSYHVVSLDSRLQVTIPLGFLTDGASIPWTLRSLLPRMGIYSRAATLHDYLCETYSVDRVDLTGMVTTGTITVSRKYIDNVFFEALAVDKCPKWKLAIIKVGVNLYRGLFNPRKPNVDKRKQELELEYANELKLLTGDCITDVLENYIL